MASVREAGKFDPSQQFSFRYSLEHYLAWNSQDSRSGYVVSARKQAELLNLQHDSVVIEVAGGTGNSGLAFISAVEPRPKKLLIIDRSDNAIIAGRRFDQVQQKVWYNLLNDVAPVPDEVLKNIERSRIEARNSEIPVHIIRARSQEIPLPSETADAMFCVQGFHWFLFSDADIAGTNPEYALTALREMRRVLKPGAELVFDTHGGAIDFGSAKLNDMLLNDLHMRNHPAARAFADALNHEFAKAHFGVTIDPNRPNKYFGVLTEAFIERILEDAGFLPIPLSEDSLFFIEPLPLTIDDFITSQERGGQMVYFTDLRVSNLDDTEKAILLRNAAVQAKSQYHQSWEDPLPHQFLVFFKAKAI